LAHSSSADDGFREIQLNGKQLVFLFMAATVVSVVIFLCGVLVGRGVRPIGPESTTAAASDRVTAEPAVPEESSLRAFPSQPASTEPPPTPDELSYYERLEREGTAAETLKGPVEVATVSPAQISTPPAAVAAATRQPAAKGAAAAPVADPSTKPAGVGYAVQVAALRAHGDADTIAKRLADKGYPAYVVTPLSGAPVSVYRVRVGKFKTRREAEQVAARLEKEEQFKPWVLR
jgi:cell division septation protein DedD